MAETRLTLREHQVLAYVAGGLTDRAIALLLECDEETVSHHLRHIYGKLGAANRAQAVYLAIQADIDLSVTQTCN